jgi:predicted DNA-binding protein YlxM (UPF0122 family)
MKALTPGQKHYAAYIKLLPGEKKANSEGSHLSGLALMSKTEVAKRLGITKQAVHQAERRALWKLRQALLPLWLELKKHGAI